MLVLAIALGAVLGGVARWLVPESVRDLVVDLALDPLFGLWTRTLNALAAPVIFFMVMTTMINMRKIDERGGSRYRTIAHYFALSFVMGIVGVLAGFAVFRPAFMPEHFNTEHAREIIRGVSSLVPEHIVEPFTTSNTPQLLIIALALGNAIIVLGDRTQALTRVVRQANMVSSLVTRWVSALVPLFACLLVAFEVWHGEAYLLAQIWRPLLLSFVVAVACMLFEVLRTSARLKISPRKMLRKLWPPFRVAVRTGSLEDAYGEAEHSCVHGLGIDKTLTNVALPQGLVLYMPASIMGTLVFTVFSAHMHDVTTSIMWFVVAVVLDVLLFVATPPVPGANLLAFITLFQQLGIPQDAFLDAMIFDIMCGIVANAANQAMLQVTFAEQADRMGMLDHKCLRR